MSIIFLNGHYVHEKDARISPFDRGFTFGEGIYEVCIAINGKFVDALEHLARLERSLKECGIDTPPERDELSNIMSELLQKNDITTGLVYLQITPGASPRNFTIRPEGRPTLLMLAQGVDFKRSPAFLDGIHVQMRQDIRWLRRDIKTTMLMPQVMAKRDALSNGVSDTLYYDEYGITEGASSNVFLVDANGTLITRALSNHLLAGCTRARILDLAQNIGLTVEDRPIQLTEFVTAAECFVTSATYLIAPILTVDGVIIKDGKAGPITRLLQNKYCDYIEYN
ncbi:aminotransferase class IV [Neokomagataea thailandica]|uniref:Probable branched-chain-amino-acid aminotransferase n=1 Tax=Neokomagataea tanensis NBRC 106556 TaxID=1223519 RepID=A0ABQ0QGH2_9PROT|nr:MULTISPECIES: aminotransferase class IV [Neokomagataea]GBR43973.1 aminotransferase class IV [Neokomagataea tanensis NBRC 106556]